MVSLPSPSLFVRLLASRLPGVIRVLGILCLSLGLVGVARAGLDDELREATRLHHAGQTEVALARIDAWLASHPKEAQMRFLKSVVLVDSGRAAEAASLLEQLAEDYPELPEPHNNLAAIRAAQGDWAGARRELEEALRLQPNHAAARENLGDVYVMLAAEQYRRALIAEPGNTTVPRKLELVRQFSLPRAASSVGAAR